jgi:hypothetical protein
MSQTFSAWARFNPELHRSVRGTTVMPKLARALVTLTLCASPVVAAHADDLSGSRESMAEQHEAAVKQDYSFLRTPAAVRRMVEIGALVPVPGNADYALSKVSFPYTRPEVLALIEKVAADYRATFHAPLVVTSLTRPTIAQPRNASPKSVHPAGMAVDFRVPATSMQRAWLEAELLKLERLGAVDVTRERRPAHYHVAVFGDKLLPLVAGQDSVRVAQPVRLAAEEPRVEVPIAQQLVHPFSAEPDQGLPGAGGFAVAALALLGLIAGVHRARS